MTYPHEEIKIENKAQIWADGACSRQKEGVGGWGALIIENGKERRIYGGCSPTTNNQMEILAAIKALQDLKEASIVTIYTDSKYLVDGIKSWIFGWKRNGWRTKEGLLVKNQQLWQQLDNLCNGHRITWAWVRGHAGNRGNEIADQLAVRGKEEEKEKIRKSLSVKNV